MSLALSVDTAAASTRQLRRVLLVFCGALLFGVAYAGVHLLPIPFGTRATIESVLYMLPVVLAVLASALAVRKTRGRLRLEWALICLAVIVFASVEAYWSVYASYVDPAGPPLQSFVVDFSLLAYMLMIPVILLSVESKRASRFHWIGDSADFGLVLLVSLFLAQVLVLKPAHATLFLHDSGELTEFLSIVFDLAFCAFLLGYKWSRHLTPNVLLGTAFGSWAVADTAYFATLSTGSYVSGGPVAYSMDLLWMAGWFLIAATAWLRIRKPEGPSLFDAPLDGVVNLVPILAGPAALVIGIPYLVYVVQHGQADRWDYYYAIGIGTLVAVLVSVRSSVMYLENLKLTRTLSEHARSENLRANTNENQFRTIFDRAPLGIVRTDADTGRFIEVNPAFARIVGRSEVELQALTMDDIAHLDDEVLGGETWRKLRDRELDYHERERLYVRPDGTEVWVALTVAPLSADNMSSEGLLGIIDDITARKHDEKQMALRIQFDDLFAGILARLAGSNAEQTDPVIVDALSVFAQFLCVDNIFVVLLSQDRQSWSVAHAWHVPGVDPHFDRTTQVPLDATPWIAGVLMGGSAVRVSSLDDMPDGALADRQFIRALGIESILQVPMRGLQGVVVGGIGVGARSAGREWTDEDVRLTGLLGSAIGNTLERQRAQQDVEVSQMSMIFALAKLAGSRDDATGRHLARVQGLCLVLAEELQRDPDYRVWIDGRFVTLLSNAAPLHDVGKVGIPDAILLKPGRLTPEEFEIVKSHTVIGAETLEAVEENHPANEFIRMGVDIARSHHERWNGTGYPDGLSGSGIPLAARIMAVADVYEAVRSPRIYKGESTRAEAAEIIRAGAGTQFDPAVVAAFERAENLLAEVWEATE